MNFTSSLSPLLLLGLVAGASGVDQPATPAGPPHPWKEMTVEQKAKYMKQVVVPKMRVVFQQFDRDEFKKFGCETCHGKKAKARELKMPNPDLFALPGSPAAFAPLMEKKPKAVKFISGTVKPQMAALLGLPELDPKKPEAGGFGCIACHTTKKD